MQIKCEKCKKLVTVDEVCTVCPKCRGVEVTKPSGPTVTASFDESVTCKRGVVEEGIIAMKLTPEQLVGVVIGTIAERNGLSSKVTDENYARTIADASSISLSILMSICMTQNDVVRILESLKDEVQDKKLKTLAEKFRDKEGIPE